MSEKKVQLVQGCDRESLASVYEELGAEIPTDEQANVITLTEDNELLAVVTAEILVRTDMWWVAPEYRKTSRAASFIRTLAKYLFKNVPKGSSVVIFAKNENQGRLFTKLGFREVQDVIKVYRIDV